MNDTIITLPRSAAATAAGTSTLTRLAASAPGVTVKYDHSGKRTIFSRWLAINRGRHDTRFRHSRKKFAQLVLKEEDIALADGITCFDNGEKLAYFSVVDGVPTRLEDASVPNLKDDQYVIWHL